MFEMQFKECHLLFAVRAFQGVISKGEEDVFTPSVEAAEESVPGGMDSPAARGRVISPVAGIKPIIAGHLEVPFRDMLDQELYEVDGRDGLLDKDIVFMPVVMESDVLPVIGVDAGKRNDRAAQVAADIFNYGIRIGKGRFSIDIKAILILTVDKGFGLFEGWPDPLLHFVKENGLESLAQVGIIEMLHRAPESFVREAAFGDEAVDMRVPFQGPTEGMEEADEARDKVLGHVDLMEHMGHDLADSLEEAIEEGAVLQEEMPEPLINGEDAVAVLAAEELEGHGGGAFLAVLDATGRAEPALAAERDELHLAALGAGRHGSAEGRVAAVDHFLDVLHFNGPGMESILDDFKIVLKNLL